MLFITGFFVVAQISSNFLSVLTCYCNYYFIISGGALNYILILRINKVNKKNPTTTNTYQIHVTYSGRELLTNIIKSYVSDVAWVLYEPLK